MVTKCYWSLCAQIRDHAALLASKIELTQLEIMAGKFDLVVANGVRSIFHIRPVARSLSSFGTAIVFNAIKSLASPIAEWDRDDGEGRTPWSFLHRDISSY